MSIRDFFTSKWVVLSFIAFVFLYAWFLSAPISAILIGLGGNAFIGYIISGPKCKGPASDHFDGKKFINPGGVEAKGLGGLLKWMLNRERGEWKKLKDVIYGEKPKVLVENGLRVTFVNHSTFLIQADGLNILTDPVWSERASPFGWAGPKRMRPPGIRFDDLPPIDVVLLSHNHYDHLDMPTMKKVYEKFRPKIFTALGIKEFLDQNEIRNSTDMDWWDELILSENLKLVAVPAQHFSGRGMFDRDATLWCGFLIKRRDGNIYFAGDTGYNETTFIEIGERFAPIRVALLPIGAYKPRWFMSPIHTSPAEAVKIHRDVKAQKSIATHFGTFPLADDGAGDPLNDLRNALEELSVPSGNFLALTEGDGMEFY